MNCNMTLHIVTLVSDTFCYHRSIKLYILARNQPVWALYGLFQETYLLYNKCLQSKKTMIKHHQTAHKLCCNSVLCIHSEFPNDSKPGASQIVVFSEISNARYDYSSRAYVLTVKYQGLRLSLQGMTTGDGLCMHQGCSYRKCVYMCK